MLLVVRCIRLYYVRKDLFLSGSFYLTPTCQEASEARIPESEPNALIFLKCYVRKVGS